MWAERIVVIVITYCLYSLKSRGSRTCLSEYTTSSPYQLSIATFIVFHTERRKECFRTGRFDCPYRHSSLLCKVQNIDFLGGSASLHLHTTHLPPLRLSVDFEREERFGLDFFSVTLTVVIDYGNTKEQKYGFSGADTALSEHQLSFTAAIVRRYWTRDERHVVN